MYGGTKAYFISLIYLLSNNGYKITVVLKKNQLDEEILRLQQNCPFEVITLEFDIWRTQFKKPIFTRLNKTYLIYQARELLYFWKILQKTKASLLICSIGNPEELIFLFLSPVRMLYAIHTATMDRMDKFKRFILNARLSKKRRIITVSNFAKKHVLLNWTNGHHSNDIMAVHNYYHLLRDNKKVDKNNPLTILTIGTVGFYKNPILWIDICKEVEKRFPDPIQFIWAGDGAMLDECLELTKDHPQIRFIGYESNVEKWYECSYIYIQPSITESHGIALLGAMAHKIPSIISNVGGMVESIDDGKSGFIIPEENKTLYADKVLELLCNPVLHDNMGEEAFQKYNKYFTRNSWTTNMNSLLETN